MLLKQWRTSSSRLEKLPSIPLGLGIYLFKDWHNSESPLRWDENIFHSQIQVHALLEVRAENISWLIPSILFPAASTFSAVCYSSPGCWDFLCSLWEHLFNSSWRFPSPCYCFLHSPSCLVHENPPVLAPKGQYLEMETRLLDSWKGRASQGIRIELVPALPFPTGFAAVTKCTLMAQQWFLGTVCGVWWSCGTAELWEFFYFCVTPSFFCECCVSAVLFLFPVSLCSGSGGTHSHVLSLIHVFVL